ncbi:hypothetical protein LLS1_02130 [Leifsonia sp. LS1]|uniref:hypothetical protein n=1 Tax=Leifsonia sp. LS1 TaxID=2828483 RepID=UPI001CFD124E|nr:hypothetical protein [Leifsonia sp. LS1]GIT78544.1 hypothetical protein LLS1_02130 [Leifsonia sp. LS1]
MAGDESGRRVRTLIVWSGIGLLLLVALFAAFGAVQRTYYSASGFVAGYMQTLAARDVAAALGMPGAAPTSAALKQAGLPSSASRELLRADLLPRIADIRVVSDRTRSSGVHDVTVQATSDGHAVSATFAVEQSGSVLGILPLWRFATTPLTVAHITVAHAQDFTIASHTVDPRAAAPDQPANAFSVAADYLMFAPGRYVLGHTSRYLDAAPAVVLAAPARTVETTVDAQPTQAFTDAVQKQLNAFLDQCATQQVLQPAGCPFGVEIDDRVQGAPAWTMATYPAVHLSAGATAWTMDQAVGVAHLSVTVQSLFDGTIDQRESDERFAVSLTSVTIRSDGSLDIVVGQ